MALKQYNPVTPGTRQLTLVNRAGLYKGKPIKALTEGLTKKGGRNNTGRVTARRIGGGGMATALISWMLGKSVAITGLVAYQLAGSHVYFWPFLGVFALVMATMNPTRFEAPERPRG